MIHNEKKSWFFFSSDLFSSGLFFTEILFHETLLAGKKVPGIQNTGFYFQWHFLQGLEKIRTFFQVFFPETFFPGTFLHRFFLPHWEISKTLFVSSKHQYGWTDRFQNILLELLWQQKRFRDDSMQSHQFIEKSPQNFV